MVSKRAEMAAGRPFKPTKQQLIEAEGKTVPDVMGPDLRVLFCGINPGLYTAAVGHHFARPGNRFWPALHLSGFTDRLLSPFAESELLPLGERFTPPTATGGTPLVLSHKLAAQWGIKNLYLKNDAVCFPSLSFKDRVVGTALAAARRFGFETVGCSSTGNLANAVAAQAAQQGFDACVFIPADLEPAKVLNTAVYGARIVRINGNYDHVNRL